jgi:hypothetical protein
MSGTSSNTFAGGLRNHTVSLSVRFSKKNALEAFGLVYAGVTNSTVATITLLVAVVPMTRDVCVAVMFAPPGS